MPYEKLASSKTPALIIYVLDVSASMSSPLGVKRRIDVVVDALAAALRQMVTLSTKGVMVSPRYRIAMFAYSDVVYDLLDGVRTVDAVAQMGVPNLEPMRSTDTSKAFESVESLLKREIPSMTNCPAPLVCHMTDGWFTGDDPTPTARRIMSMRVPDGNVLLENIFISDDIVDGEINNARSWNGILPKTELRNEYARCLREISSPLPRSYLAMMIESGYQISDKAVMMLPGMNPDLVKMGFVMSTATPVAR